jgi:chromosome segregation ATPase
VAVDYLHLQDRHKKNKLKIKELEDNILELNEEMTIARNNHQKQLAVAWKHHEDFAEEFYPRYEAKVAELEKLQSELEQTKSELKTVVNELEALKTEHANSKHDMSILDFNSTRNDETGGNSAPSWRKEKEDLEKKLFEADEVCAKLSEDLEKVRSDRSLTSKELDDLFDTLCV